LNNIVDRARLQSRRNGLPERLKTVFMYLSAFRLLAGFLSAVPKNFAAAFAAARPFWSPIAVFNFAENCAGDSTGAARESGAEEASVMKVIAVAMVLENFAVHCWWFDGGTVRHLITGPGRWVSNAIMTSRSFGQFICRKKTRYKGDCPKWN